MKSCCRCNADGKLYVNHSTGTSYYFGTLVPGGGGITVRSSKVIQGHLLVGISFTRKNKVTKHRRRCSLLSTLFLHSKGHTRPLSVVILGDQYTDYRTISSTTHLQIYFERFILQTSSQYWDFSLINIKVSKTKDIFICDTRT
jgi:hypothetical protein